jgi:DNA-binding Xre family transcriptional regulator
MKGNNAQMARLRIKEVAEKKGITTAYQLQQALGVQATVAYRLWRGTSKLIALETIQTLCTKLKTTPNQLIEIEDY